MREIQDYLRGVDAATADLALRVSDGDDYDIWSGLADSLAWLYRTELALRRLRADYFDLRKENAYGRVLGGLVYFRGEVEHSHAEDAYVLGWLKTETFVASEGGWRRVTPMVSTGTEWVETEAHISSPVYPQLHPSAKSDAQGRDHWYREKVAGRSLVKPLTEAAGFLRSLNDD